MIIRIDQQDLGEQLVSGNNLEEILGNLQENHVPSDRMISEVHLNGKPYNEDVPHAAVEVSRQEIETLELLTITTEEIADHFLQNGPKLVNSQLDSLPKIIEMFRLGDEAEANEHFLRFLESLHLLINMLERVARVIGVRFDVPIDDHNSLEERLQNMADILSRLLQIQEQSDWIYLADILEYELIPELEALRDILPHLKRTVS